MKLSEKFNLPAYYSCPKCNNWVQFRHSNVELCTNCGAILQVQDSPYPKVLESKRTRYIS